MIYHLEHAAKHKGFDAALSDKFGQHVYKMLITDFAKSKSGIYQRRQTYMSKTGMEYSIK